MGMPYKGNQPSVIGYLSRESGTLLLVQCAWIVCLMYASKRELWMPMSSAILLNYVSCPKLLQFDGYNPRSVVVMDNASIHHVDYAASLIEEMGALVVFLPPYSPALCRLRIVFQS